MKKILIMMLVLWVFIISSYGQDIKKENKYISYKATAYCLNRNPMSSGIYPTYGYIAVDSRIIKIGTKVHILSLGNFIAGDTGSKIIGNRIDIFISNCSLAKKFGVKKILLKIL